MAAHDSNKRTQINKANTRMVVIIAVASFMVVFSLVACRALISQWAYQGRVIKEKQKAVDQLQTNVKAVDTLQASYSAFVGRQENLLKGSSSGTGDRDGDNARIVLDALPSKYDFPGLTSSLEKILTGYTVNGIVGTDDEVAQQQNLAATTPVPIEMPFTLDVSAGYDSIQTLVLNLERSIRPMQIQRMQVSGDQNQLEAVIDAKTYYQPEKSLKIRTEVVK